MPTSSNDFLNVLKAEYAEANVDAAERLTAHMIQTASSAVMSSHTLESALAMALGGLEEVEGGGTVSAQEQFIRNEVVALWAEKTGKSPDELFELEKSYRPVLRSETEEGKSLTAWNPVTEWTGWSVGQKIVDVETGTNGMVMMVLDLLDMDDTPYQQVSVKWEDDSTMDPDYDWSHLDSRIMTIRKASLLRKGVSANWDPSVTQFVGDLISTYDNSEVLATLPIIKIGDERYRLIKELTDVNGKPFEDLQQIIDQVGARDEALSQLELYALKSFPASWSLEGNWNGVTDVVKKIFATNAAMQRKAEILTPESFAGNWKKFESFGWRGKPEDADNWGIYYTNDRDSGLLDQSNAAAITERMSKFPEYDEETGVGDVMAEHHGHWAVGWVDGFAVRVYDANGSLTPAYEELQKITEELDEYPILDEDAYSKKEMEAEWENSKDAIEDAVREINRADFDFELDVTEDVRSAVLDWLSNNDPNALENTEDKGAYPSTEEVIPALIALGYYTPKDADAEAALTKARKASWQRKSNAENPYVMVGGQKKEVAGLLDVGKGSWWLVRFQDVPGEDPEYPENLGYGVRANSAQEAESALSLALSSWHRPIKYFTEEADASSVDMEKVMAARQRRAETHTPSMAWNKLEETGAYHKQVKEEEKALTDKGKAKAELTIAHIKAEFPTQWKERIRAMMVGSKVITESFGVSDAYTDSYQKTLANAAK